jgi:hypothetical protein
MKVIISEEYVYVCRGVARLGAVLAEDASTVTFHRL